MFKQKISFIFGVFWIVCAFSFHPIALALDLKIDLPLSQGKVSTPLSDSKKNRLSSSLELPSAKNRPSSSIGLSPAIIENDVSEWDEIPLIAEPLTSKSLAVDKGSFPELPCLKSNIIFWEKVYAKFDTNDAILHDRSQPGRIYGVLRNLPKSKYMRESLLRRAQRKYEGLFASLARKWSKPRTWTPQEKRLASLFSKNEFSYQAILNARDDIRVQFGLKSQFNAGVLRSMNYLPIIYPIVKKSGLPIDLIFLPHVESSYNSRAGSKVGAMGLWQLMPSTMSILAGRQNVSKRTDPAISTRAAMKLLRTDFEKIRNWPLVLTAYNHGNNGILRAMEETRSRNLCQVIERYSSPSFKFASANFYAQFVAARKVAIEKYRKLDKKQTGPLLRRVLLSATGGKFE